MREFLDSPLFFIMTFVFLFLVVFKIMDDKVKRKNAGSSLIKTTVNFFELKSLAADFKLPYFT